MDKKILAAIIIILAVAAIAFVAFGQRNSDAGAIKRQFLQKFEATKSQYEEAKVKGYDVSEAERLGQEALQAYNKKEYKKAGEFLARASRVLSDIVKSPPTWSPYPSPQPSPVTPSTTPSSSDKRKARERLAQVKVASHYRYVTDGIRSVDDAINIFKETETDFIVLGWGRINLIPDKCSDLPQGEQKACDAKGYSYEYLRNAAAKIKSAMPNVIFGGGLSAEFLNPESINEMTGEKLTKDQTWAMALDPKKWGIKMSKDEFQTKVAISHGWTKKGEPYNPKEQMLYYFPDQTNSAYQDLFLSWVEKQIDSGADQILIDINTKQAKLMAGATGDINHPAVRDSFKGTAEIVDKIHQYGLSKGKYIYVMSWATVTDLESPYPAQDLDAVMTTPSTEEIKALKMDEAKWDSYIASIRKKFGNIPIFVMFDQGPDYRPLEAFSQELNKEQQRQFLRTADDFFNKKGLVFIYPVHGGMMGSDARLKAKSYGKYNWYDALAPEFDTYETIKELANNKKGE